MVLGMTLFLGGHRTVFFLFQPVVNSVYLAATTTRFHTNGSTSHSLSPPS